MRTAKRDLGQSVQNKSDARTELSAMSKFLQRRLIFCSALLCRAQKLAHDKHGQGTVEYALLVGVLVVIAIVAVVAFRGNIQTLWESIANSINSL